MSDTVSFGSCGSCFCGCFGYSDGCCGESGSYVIPSNGEEIADVIETALDVGLDAYEPVPTNASRKKTQDADVDTDTCTCQSIVSGILFFSILSVIGK